MKIRELLRTAEKELVKHDIPESYAKLMANELLLQENRNLYLEMNNEADEKFTTLFNTNIARLNTQEPFAYVLGTQYFYGRDFNVDARVLIPRPETEELVANMLADIDERFADRDDLVLADIGTGSGCLAISLKLEEPRLDVYAVDISVEALDLAKENAAKLGADIQFFAGDLLEPLKERKIKVDILVCNPPYIPQDELLEESVKGFEPHVALFGGEDGLLFYKRVFEDAAGIVNKGGMLGFEIGWNQAAFLLNLARESLPDDEIVVRKDISGKDRMLMIYRK
ncbi:MAG: peptide chain release factor N(5)-glutamine methyltransferase [Erysipelotrichaceae bacterium]